MKKIVSVLLCLLLVSVSTLFTFAAEPRAAACGVCRNGKMLTFTRNEFEAVQFPCGHGYGGGALDSTIYNYQNTYYECNICHVGERIGHVYLGTKFHCSGSGLGS